MILSRYKLALIQFNLTLEQVVSNIIKKNEGEIVGLVKNRLYQKGVDGSGDLITPTYSRETILLKKKNNKRSSFVTLRESGLFYKGFYLQLSGFDLILNSSDEKTSALVNKYGVDILEFTENEKKFIINEIIDPGVEAKINSLPFLTSSTGEIELDFF